MENALAHNELKLNHSVNKMFEQKKTSKNLSIQTKLQLLADLHRKQGTKQEIAEKYGISHNTLLTIIKNRAKLVNWISTLPKKAENNNDYRCWPSFVPLILNKPERWVLQSQIQYSTIRLNF